MFYSKSDNILKFNFLLFLQIGKISYFTATFPYIMLSILVIRGALLDGIYIGVYNYVANFDVNAFAEPDLWKDAVN